MGQRSNTFLLNITEEIDEWGEKLLNEAMEKTVGILEDCSSKCKTVEDCYLLLLFSATLRYSATLCKCGSRQMVKITLTVSPLSILAARLNKTLQTLHQSRKWAARQYISIQTQCGLNRGSAMGRMGPTHGPGNQQGLRQAKQGWGHAVFQKYGKPNLAAALFTIAFGG